MSRERGRPRLSTGLLFAQLAVLVVAAVVAAVTAALVGPPLFHEHMVRAGADPSSSTLAHVEEAFRSAGLITLATAGGAAVLAAAVVAWVAVPWVSMARRGTVDQRTVAAWRAECVVPLPRRAPDDVAAEVIGP